jgi:hypothetical protein
MPTASPNSGTSRGALGIRLILGISEAKLVAGWRPSVMDRAAAGANHIRGTH